MCGGEGREEGGRGVGEGREEGGKGEGGIRGTECSYVCTYVWAGLGVHLVRHILLHSTPDIH